MEVSWLVPVRLNKVSSGVMTPAPDARSRHVWLEWLDAHIQALNFTSTSKAQSRLDQALINFFLLKSINLGEVLSTSSGAPGPQKEEV